MIKLKSCSICKMCCSYSTYKGKKLTQNHLLKHFDFSEHMCDTFFHKSDGHYFIDEFCRQHSDDGSCKLYDKPSFPFNCAIYPFFLAEDRKGKFNVVIDHLCPHYHEAQPFAERVVEIAQRYKNFNQPVKIYKEKDLIRLGYKIFTILYNVDFKEEQ